MKISLFENIIQRILVMIFKFTLHCVGTLFVKMKLQYWRVLYSGRYTQRWFGFLTNSIPIEKQKSENHF